MWVLLLWTLNVLSLSCLAAAMGKHQRDLFGHTLVEQQTLILQLVGSVLVFISMILGILVWGGSIGVSVLIGVLTFAALLVTLMITYKPKGLITLNIGAFILSLLTVGAIVF